MLLLLGVLEALQEQVLGVFIELHVQEIQLLYPLPHILADVHVGGPRDIELGEGGNEFQVECPLKEILCFPLKFRQPEEGHVFQIVLGALEENHISLTLVHESQVVAPHQAEVCQHAHLAVAGQVVATIHEFL